MHSGRFVVAGAGLLVAAGAVLAGTAAEAAVPTGDLGALTPTPPSGADVQAPTYTTEAGCPDGSDGYNMFIYGPGVFEPGLIGTTTTDVGFSTETGFIVQQGLSFADIAKDHQSTVQAGRYDIVVNCIDTFTQDVKGRFAMPLWFTEPTKWQTTDPGAGGPTTSTTTTSGTPTTSASSSTTETSSSSSDTSTTESSTPAGPSSEAGGGPGGDGGTGSPGPDAGNAGKPLASTGVAVGYLLVTGLALLAAGIVAVLAGARRRREPTMSAWPE